MHKKGNTLQGEVLWKTSLIDGSGANHLEWASRDDFAFLTILQKLFLEKKKSPMPPLISSFELHYGDKFLLNLTGASEAYNALDFAQLWMITLDAVQWSLKAVEMALLPFPCE